MSTQYIRFLEKLKEYRIAQSKTQQDIVDVTDMSLRTINNLEGGKNVSVFYLIEYIEALGLLNILPSAVPISDVRFEDLPKGRNKRERARKKRKKAFVWAEDKDIVAK